MKAAPPPRAGVLRSLWLHRSLVRALTRREIVGRYRGSLLGAAWTLVTPLLLLGIYSFIFGVVLKVRWSAGQSLDTGFAAILFCGIILHAAMSETLNSAPNLIARNVNFVKKVAFPLEVLPWVTVLSAVFHYAFALVVLVGFVLITQGAVSLTVALLPLIVAPYMLLLLGMAWFLASLGVYVRDVAQVTGFLTTAMLFLSPIFYPLTAVPEPYRYALYGNPLTVPVIEVRKVLLFGQAPDLAVMAVYWMAAAAICVAGFLWFQKTRKGFADVL